MNRRFRVLGFVVATIFGATNAANAHVVVFPGDASNKAPACGFTVFSVRVPTEKPIATTSVRVEIPRTVTVIATQAKPGWHAQLETTKGRITAITWSGAKIMPREFDTFAFLAAAPKQTGSVNWDAEQTYEDGSVVKWTGNPGSDTPHSQTIFTAPQAPCSKRSVE